ncbi:MAG: NUDIX hydrolase [Planctomycetes bacterium]|nr:NUDIX hydrolase [Planctomycetota bacterium]
MHRHHLNLLLERYAARWPAERELARRFLAFAAAHPDCLSRRCVPGHVTASAWILSPDGGSALLTHHEKLGRWLQLGGHVDGEARIELGALREAQEESGMARLRFVDWAGGAVVPLDLDVHGIPACGTEPAHDHWDVRFLLQAAAGQRLVVSAESRDLRWFTAAELAVVTGEESVLRLSQKARACTAGPGPLRHLAIC